jgi:signal transduction histidine kinase
MNINILGIATILIALINLFLGAFVLYKNPKNSNNRSYAFAVFSIAIWSLATFFYNNPIFLSPKDWLIIVYLASYVMLLSQALLVYYFPEKSKKSFFIILGVLILTILPSFYVLIIQDSVILSAQHFPIEYKSLAEMGPGYFIYTIPNTLGILLLSIAFLLKGKRFTGFSKVQIQYYTIGALCMIIPIVVLDYLVPLIWGSTAFYVYGPIFVIPFSISVAYSLIQNRFVDIKTILYRVIILVEETLFFVLAFFLIYKYTDSILKENGLTKAIGFILILAPIAILIFRIYTKYFRKLIDKVILTQTKTPEEILNRFSRSNSVELDTEKISINVRKTIKELLGVDRVGILLLDLTNTKILYRYLHNFNIEGTRDLLEVLHYWDELGEDPILVTDEIKREIVFGRLKKDSRLTRILHFLDKYEISGILPLNRETQLNGVLILGYKEMQMPLSVSEIEQLELLIAQTSVAMGRSLLYKEVQDLNSSLQQRVSDQTQELRQKVKQLEEARRKEADMIDIMGHELRTPMSVIKLNTDLLQKFTTNVPKKKEEYVKYVKRIKDAVDTEIRLINTLLSSAKLEGDKIELNPEKVDIIEQIKMSTHAQEGRAKRKGIDILTQFDNQNRYVFADHARTVEILNNLIDNAVKYTEKGSVTITTKGEDDFVRISITDTGLGMSKEDVSRLGDKFFRTSNYTQSEYSDDIDIVRPGGTGLGLYVTFNLVRRMGGEIHVESELGKGSNFTFTLPKYVGQESKPRSDTQDMFERLGLKE